jgi:cystathionine beta-lyase
MIDFNTPISRLGTHAEKYEARQTLFGREDILPMWVADMDLATPDFVLQAMRDRLDHPILGYTQTPDSVLQAIVDWQADHDYRVLPEQIVFTHNVANGLFLAIRAFSQIGDAVLVFTPIYPPFMNGVKWNERKLIACPLSEMEGEYQMNFERLEALIEQHNIKLILLSNPHNPSGRVWRRAELERLAGLCLARNVVMVSDEIHSDLVLAPHRHCPLAGLSSEVAMQTVTLRSPGKTFNLAGLHIGYALIANPQLRQAYQHQAAQVKIEGLNLLGYIALQACYSSQGREWMAKLKTHLQGHIDQVIDFFAEHYPLVRIQRPQAGYLIWIDFREMIPQHEQLKRWLIDQVGIGLNDGLSYGSEGEGWMRLNIGVPQSTLDALFRQLECAPRWSPKEDQMSQPSSV